MAAEPEPLAAVRANAAIEITDDRRGDRARARRRVRRRRPRLLSRARRSTRGRTPQAVGARRRGRRHRRHHEAVAQPRVLRPAAAVDVHRSRAGRRRRGSVGGHSLGGVRACQLATDADGARPVRGRTARSTSPASGLPVLSIAGSEDGLSTPREDRRRAAPAARRRRARRDRGREPLELRRLRPAARRRHPDDLGRGHDARSSPNSSAPSLLGRSLDAGVGLRHPAA